MNSHPLVSIVTVTYNDDKLIEQTIRSVTSQTYKNIEYIIIDGNSTDNTIEIVNKYKSKISRVISESDEGIYDAMNKAIDIASGEWINFMNSGDTFTHKSVVENFISSTPDSADVVYGDHFYIEGNNKELRKSIISKIYSDITFNHQSMFYKMSVIRSLYFNLCYKIVADCEMHIIAYKQGYEFYYLDSPVANFIAGGLNQERRTQTILEFMHVLSIHTDESLFKNSDILNLFVRENSEGRLGTKFQSDNEKFSGLKNHINKLLQVKFIKHPIKKVKLYYQLANYYHSCC